MTEMKQLLPYVCVVALLVAGGAATADDLSWWGHGACPEPYADDGSACSPEARGRYWWWPAEPESNANDSELWGNRGIVYGMYVPKEEPAPAPTPPPAKPPKETRKTPVFNHVLFDFDKSVLKAEGKAEADKVVALLKQYKKDTLLIEGHTCTVGEEDYNMGLGQRRADAIQKYIVGQGIAAGRVSTKSFGEAKPAVPNDTPANRKLNRRGIFVVSIAN